MTQIVGPKPKQSVVVSIVPARDAIHARGSVVSRKVVQPVIQPVLPRTSSAQQMPEIVLITSRGMRTVERGFRRSNPAAPSVRLGDVAASVFEKAFADLKNRKNMPYRKVGLIETIRCRDPSYVDGEYVQSHRRTEVEYRRKTKPAVQFDPRMKDELHAWLESTDPLPKLYYKPDEWFGDEVYVQFADDRHGGNVGTEDDPRWLMMTGMFAKTYRHSELVERVFHPIYEDRAFAESDYIVVSGPARHRPYFYSLEGALYVARLGPGPSAEEVADQLLTGFVT